MGEKYCIVMICLILKQKESWCVKPVCQGPSPQVNKTVLKNNSFALTFLEKAADLGCRVSLKKNITFQDTCSSQNLQID